MAINYINSIPNASSPIPEMTWKTLHQANRIIPVPFNLVCPTTEIRCEEVVRVIPGKRVVAFGTWNEKPVVAKLFFGVGKAKQHIERELNGIKALLEVNIPTPKLLFQGAAENEKIQVLLFERILEAKSLDEIWQDKKDPQEVESLMKAITIELATQHVLGIVQSDLHLKNFIVADKQIYTLDGGSISQVEDVLPREQSLDHLALFFSQLGVGAEKLQDKLFETYAKSRGWLINKADVDMLKKLVREWTDSRWSRYQKKIKRDCSAFALDKTLTRTMMYDRSYQSEDFFTFLKNPDSVFLNKNSHILKSGRSSTVAKFQMNNRYFVVKRYNVKNIWHKIRRLFRSTRAMKSWNLAQRLRLFGITTAKPVAFIENRFLMFRGKSYFVMECVEGLHAGNYFSSYREEDEQAEKVAKRIVKLFFNLAEINLTHGDLKMTNILIENQRPVLIDLDGMLEHQTQIGLKFAFKKEIQRFMENWNTQPSVRALFERILYAPTQK